MLVWSRSGRFIVWLLAALLIGIIFIAPLAVILAASLAQQWNGVLPTGFTFEHFGRHIGLSSRNVLGRKFLQPRYANHSEIDQLQ